MLQETPAPKGDQTITFAAPPDTRLDEGPVSIGATASSGLAVSYVSNDELVCTISADSAVLVAEGTCSITASQAGDTDWNAAPDVTRTFEVLAPKGDQTITFAAPPDTRLDAGLVTLDATASSGLAVSYLSNDTEICTVSGDQVNLVAEGTCSITASQAGDTDWNAAPDVTRTFEVRLVPVLFGHFSAGGADQAGGAVYVFSADAYVYVGAATADGSGDYSIDLAPGDYKLYLGPVSAGYGLQWYGGSGDWDTATPITVSGATAEDIALPPLASASNLSGHFSAGGADQAGGAVYVFSADAYVYVGAATADGSGDYSIDLAPGDYKLYLGPVSAGYGLQWYGGSGDWDTATPITVSGATTEDIALPPLASASNLSGHFSAGGADQAGGAVYVFSADAYVYVGAATADGSGDYSIDLAPGDYKLYLGPVSAGYGLQWYGGSGDWDTATPITVSGATTEDIALPPLASASNLSGHFSAGGADQAGGAVYVFSADAYVYVGAATADGSGDYSIDLAPGDYKLYLGPVSAGYGLQWYGGSGDWDTATPITVSGATVEDIVLP